MHLRSRLNTKYGVTDAHFSNCATRLAALCATRLAAQYATRLAALCATRLAALGATRLAALGATRLAALGATRLAALGATRLAALGATRLAALGATRLAALDVALGRGSFATLYAALAVALGCGLFATRSMAADDARARTHQAIGDAVDLSWARSSEADNCISGSELKRAVRHRLGREPFTEPAAATIEGFVTRRAGKWSADIIVRSAPTGRIGNRHLESKAADCRELDEAVVLTITLIIDPNARLQPESVVAAGTAPDQHKKVSDAAASAHGGASHASQREPDAAASAIDGAAQAPQRKSDAAAPAPDGDTHASQRGPDAAAPATDEDPYASERAASAGSTVHGGALRAPLREPEGDAKNTAAAADAAALAIPLPPGELRSSAASMTPRLVLAPSLAYNLLPGPTAGLALRGELALARTWTGEIAAAFYPERRRETAGSAVGYGLTALGAAGCYQPNRPVTLLACAGGWFGVAHAVVYSGVPDRPGERFWSGVRTDIGVAATSDRLVLQLRALGIFPITRWRFSGPSGQLLFEQPWVVPGVEIAVGLRLP